MQVWIYVAKRGLTDKQKVVFRARRETPELREFLAKRGWAWMEEAGRRALRQGTNGVDRLRLSEWLARCRIAAYSPTSTGSPHPVRRGKFKSVADLPAQTRYDDDT
jgi:hypothetical protein